MSGALPGWGVLLNGRSNFIPIFAAAGGALREIVAIRPTGLNQEPRRPAFGWKLGALLRVVNGRGLLGGRRQVRWCWRFLPVPSGRHGMHPGGGCTTLSGGPGLVAPGPAAVGYLLINRLGLCCPARPSRLAAVLVCPLSRFFGHRLGRWEESAAPGQGLLGWFQQSLRSGETSPTRHRAGFRVWGFIFGLAVQWGENRFILWASGFQNSFFGKLFCTPEVDRSASHPISHNCCLADCGRKRVVPLGPCRRAFFWCWMIARE